MGVSKAAAPRFGRTAHPGPPLLSVAVLSAAALAYEILLTRIFAIVHWHHLVAVAISLALLGYGVSGTFLFLARSALQRHIGAAYVGNALLFAVATLACAVLAQRFAFDPESLAWDPQAWIQMALAFLVLAIPFFAAANCIGLVLIAYRQRIATVYAADLFGAGAGAFAILLGLALLPPGWLLPAIMAGGCIAAILAAHRLHWHPLPTMLFCGLSLAFALAASPIAVIPAAHKDLARTLAVRGAQTLVSTHGIEGVAVVVRNDIIPMRMAPGMSLQAAATPPPQLAVFVDGDAHGTLPDHRAATDSTDYLTTLLSALPYAVRQQPARVAVVNAGTGFSVRQAIVMGAHRIDAIEPNRLLHDLACGQFGSRQRQACDPQTVTWHKRSARSFFAAGRTPFDIIALSLAADPTGTDALAIDYDLTQEAFSAYLGRLASGGLVAVEGPARTPPRLSLRVLNTLRAALLDAGVSEPATHLAMLRGWQRFIVLASPQPLDAASVARIRAFSRELGFDLAWLAGMDRAEANRFQRLPAPYFHDAARAIVNAGDAGHDFRLQVVSDDRPFAYRSTTWASLAGALSADDAAHRSRVDSGLMAAVAILVLVSLAAVVLILIPLAWLRSPAQRRPPLGMTWRTLLYFGLVGFAFLFTEIAWIQRLQLFLGDPVIATTAVLAGFLLFAGAGSAWSQTRTDADTRLLVLVTLAIGAFGLLFLALMPWLLAQLAGASLAWRVLTAVLLIAPLAFAMGIPFPLALRHIGTHAPMLVPWAWGINGATSVVAAVMTPLLAAETGFSGLTLAAAAAYLSLPVIGLVRHR